MSNYKPANTNLDWLSFADDIHAPPPDLFEFDLDKSLNGVDQSQLPLMGSVDFSIDPYQLFRTNDPVCGPPSTFTMSSESTYENSESMYSFPRSPTAYSESVYSHDLHLNLAKFSMEATEVAKSAVTAPQAHQVMAATADPFKLMEELDPESKSFGDLPVTGFNSVHQAAAAFEYDASPSLQGISPADFYLHPQPSVTSIPTPQPLPNTSVQMHNNNNNNISLPLPRVTVSMSEAANTVNDSIGADGRRKYQCSTCPRSFARAYNLKTHMATHDPHRLKPFTCPHKTCGRSFSRKHDLGRHLVSIHHDEPDKKIGVENGTRTWCDACGKGVVGSSSSCTCAN